MGVAAETTRTVGGNFIALWRRDGMRGAALGEKVIVIDLLIVDHQVLLSFFRSREGGRSVRV